MVRGIRRQWTGRLARLAAALVTAGGIAGLAGPGTAQAADCGAMTTQPATPADSAGSAELLAVTALSRCNVWAVGDYERTDVPQRALIEQWTGGPNWTVVPSPVIAGRSSVLNAISAVSANDIWAAGSFPAALGGTGGLVVHWDGSHWSQVPVPLSTGTLSGIAAPSANNVWVAGMNGADPVLLHYDGTNWTQSALPSLTPAPDPGQAADFSLGGMTATSASDVWAVGQYSSNGFLELLALHWDGSHWSQVTGPVLGGATAVSASSPSEVWAVGFTNTLHGNGSTWTGVNNPAANLGASIFDVSINGVATVSPSSAFAVGTYEAEDQSLLMRWDGHNWTQVATPDPGSEINILNGVAAGPGGTVWVVGSTRNGASFPTRATAAEFGVVPNVVGSSRAAGIDAMSNAGLVVQVSDVATVGATCGLSNNGTVLAQDKAAGTFTNARVTLTACQLPPTESVPNLFGDDDHTAQAELSAAGLTEGSVTVASDCQVDRGIVFGQSIGGGSVVPTGTAVNVTEASGKAPNGRLCPQQ